MAVVTERERMTWEDLGAGSRDLAEQIAADGFEPGLILGIARGGLLTAGALSYALDVKNTFTMNVEFYTGIDERLPVPMLLPPVPDLVDLQHERVLVADDVADTGQTLALVKEFLAGTRGEVWVEALPAYALDLSPMESAWQHLKHVELRNVTWRTWRTCTCNSIWPSAAFARSRTSFGPSSEGRD